MKNFLNHVSIRSILMLISSKWKHGSGKTNGRDPSFTGQSHEARDKIMEIRMLFSGMNSTSMKLRPVVLNSAKDTGNY